MERRVKTPELLFEDFYTDKIMNGCSERTLLNYRYCFGYYMAHSTGEFTKEAYKGFILFLTQSELSLASKNHFITHIRAFFYWLMHEGYMPHFKISLMRGQEPTCKAYTQEEIQKLLVCNTKKCSFVEHRCYVIICFILATGARANTIINIKKEDITGEYCKITTQKNKKATTIPLSPQIQRTLKDFVNSWDNESEWLFSDRYGNQLTLNAIRQSMEDYFTARNVKYHGVHSLRHTFAREFIINGGNALILQKMLGHSTLAMTKKYCYLYADDCKDIIDKMTPLDTLLVKKR